MSLEDELRETMRAHDHEAPSVTGLVVPNQHSRRARWLPAVAAAVVIAVAGGGWLAADQLSGSSHKTPVAETSEDCPASYPSDDEYWVPNKPSVSGADDRLVPDEVPQSMQVCAYLHDDKGQLTGPQEVTGNLSIAAQSLTWLPPATGTPRSCTFELRSTDGDNYLIKVSYSDGVTWIAAPGDHCHGASNGEFESSTNLLWPVSDAYRLGFWLTPGVDRQGPGRCGGSWTPGRLGQETQLVPGTPESVTICSDGRERTIVNPGALIDQLNALPTQPSTGECNTPDIPLHPAVMREYRLYFNYTEGPAAYIDVALGCSPNVDDVALQAEASPQLVELIQQMLG
jgi:hypothetical protein